MNLIKLLIVFNIFFVVIDKSIATTRQGIPDRIYPYLTKVWHPSSSNVLDIGGVYLINGSTPIAYANNREDDRREAFYKYHKEIQRISDENVVRRLIWPYEVGCNYEGVAYANKRSDDPASFGSKLGLGWIAGRRGEDPQTANDKNFTGIDCSSFVSQALGASVGGTGDIPSNCIRITNPADIKPGDILLRTGHCVLFMGGDVNSSITINHAGAWSYKLPATQSRKVISDTISCSVSGTSLKVFDGSKGISIIHDIYTAFPICGDVKPTGTKEYSGSNPQVIPIEAHFESKMGMKLLAMSVDGEDVTQSASVGGSSPYYCITYTPPAPLSFADHTVRVNVANNYNLEESREFAFKLVDSEDRDGDGMPDNWERAHGGDTLELSEPEAV